MIPAAMIAQARAVPMPQLVARDRRMKRAGAVWMTLCPVHSERTPSLAVYRDHGFCFGCGFRADPIEWLRVTRGLDFASAVGELTGDRSRDAVGTRSISNRSSSVPDAAVPDIVHRLWAEATDPSIARVYLRSRGLPCEPLSDALRGHPSVWCSETDAARPCVLAATEASRGGIIALHRIWTRTVYLASEGEDARPLDLAVRKKTLGRLAAGAVRLSPAGDRLGLAEGVESALAASKLYRLPCWAILGVSRLGHGRPMRAPSVWIPGDVRELTIFGDRGEAGEEAALFAAWWWRRQGLQARALFPENGKDFCECV